MRQRGLQLRVTGTDILRVGVIDIGQQLVKVGSVYPGGIVEYRALWFWFFGILYFRNTFGNRLKKRLFTVVSFVNEYPLSCDCSARTPIW